MEHKQRETRFKKGYHGQQAETAFELPGLRMTVLADSSNMRAGYLPVLDVSTSKTERGALVTSASVCMEKRENGFVSQMHALFADYSCRVIVTPPPVRCTAKVVEAQHAQALAMLPEILADVAQFYAAKCAKEAREHPDRVAKSVDGPHVGIGQQGVE